MLAKLLADKRIILASKSPRRQELLKGLNLPFEVITKSVDESFPESLKPLEVAGYIAEKKALAFEEHLKENTIIITSDTVVISGTEILGKPQDQAAAHRMLRKLSGQTHQVVTGVSIRSKNKIETFSVSTTVHFKSLDEDEILYYIDTYQPYDKAGSYGIQEWIGYIGIPRIEGSYFNVMGLPVYELYEKLKTFR